MVSHVAFRRFFFCVLFFFHTEPFHSLFSSLRLTHCADDYCCTVMTGIPWHGQTCRLTFVGDSLHCIRSYRCLGGVNTGDAESFNQFLPTRCGRSAEYGEGLMNRQDGFIKKYSHISEEVLGGKWESSDVKLHKGPGYYVSFQTLALGLVHSHKN